MCASTVFRMEPPIRVQLVDRPDAARFGDGQLFCAVDTETTGFRDPRIVEVAVVVFTAAGRIVRRWETRVNPGKPVEPSAVAVHGITDTMLAGAPRFPTVAGEFARMTAGRIVVAHNLPFDWRILSAEMSAARRVWRMSGTMCTLAATRQWLPWLGSHKLAKVAYALGIPHPTRTVPWQMPPCART